METHPLGVDPTNIWGAGSHILAAVNVALFFALGYIYLGGSVRVIEVAEGGCRAHRCASASVASTWARRHRGDDPPGLASTRACFTRAHRSCCA